MSKAKDRRKAEGVPIESGGGKEKGKKHRKNRPWESQVVGSGKVSATIGGLYSPRCACGKMGLRMRVMQFLFESILAITLIHPPSSLKMPRLSRSLSCPDLRTLHSRGRSHDQSDLRYYLLFPASSTK